MSGTLQRPRNKLLNWKCALEPSTRALGSSTHELGSSALFPDMFFLRLSKTYLPCVHLPNIESFSFIT
jgi:hypothetical protein